MGCGKQGNERLGSEVAQWAKGRRSLGRTILLGEGRPREAGGKSGWGREGTWLRGWCTRHPEAVLSLETRSLGVVSRQSPRRHEMNQEGGRGLGRCSRGGCGNE